MSIVIPTVGVFPDTILPFVMVLYSMVPVETSTTINAEQQYIWYE